MKYKLRYKWKHLTEDGLLKEPVWGPHYSLTYLNGCNGFDTKEEALEKLHHLLEVYKHEIPHSLILMECYEKTWE